MTKEELATTLNGREYPNKITHSEETASRESGLLILYGASDDLVEMRGTIRDEVSAYGGATILFGRDGKIISPVEREDEDVLEKYGLLEVVKQRANKAQTIRALWCAEKGGPSWTFETDIPHATFEVMEDDEVFCRGIVIDTKDLRKE